MAVGRGEEKREERGQAARAIAFVYGWKGRAVQGKGNVCGRESIQELEHSVLWRGAARRARKGQGQAGQGRQWKEAAGGERRNGR